MPSLGSTLTVTLPCVYQFPDRIDLIRILQLA